MKKTLLFASLLLFALGCVGPAEEAVQRGAFKVELLFVQDGCKMYRFMDGSKYVYWSDCRGQTRSEHTENKSTIEDFEITTK